MKEGIALVVAAAGFVGCLAGLAAQSPGARASSQAPAAPGSMPRVAVVDLSSLERVASAAGGDSLEEYRSRRLADLDRLREEIRRLQLRIAEGGATLSPDVREATLAEIRQRQESLRKAESQTRDDLEAKAALGSQAVREAVRKVARERGFELVLDRNASAVVFSAEPLDVTPIVTDALRAGAAKPVK